MGVNFYANTFQHKLAIFNCNYSSKHHDHTALFNVLRSWNKNLNAKEHTSAKPNMVRLRQQF